MLKKSLFFYFFLHWHSSRLIYWYLCVGPISVRLAWPAIVISKLSSSLKSIKSHASHRVAIKVGNVSPVCWPCTVYRAWIPFKSRTSKKFNEIMTLLINNNPLGRSEFFSLVCLFVYLLQFHLIANTQKTSLCLTPTIYDSIAIDMQKLNYNTHSISIHPIGTLINLCKSIVICRQSTVDCRQSSVVTSQLWRKA